MPSFGARIGVFMQFSEHADSTYEFMDVRTGQVVDIDFLADNKAREFDATDREWIDEGMIVEARRKYGLMLDYSSVYVCVF